MEPIDVRLQALRTAVPTWQPRTLHGFLGVRAAAHEDRPLVITGDRSHDHHG